MDRGNAIEVHGLTKTFGKMIAVNKIELQIQEGELFTFLGPNGAGKTTLIRLLTCLLKPSSGTATVGGYDISIKPLQIRRMVGVVTQDPCLYLDLTGVENLQFFGRLYGVGKERLVKRSEELLDLVQLKGRDRDLVGTYSGGMRQRLSIACALVHDPRIVFFDEPTAGLDPQTKRVIWGFMKDLQKRGITVVLSTHYLEEADALSDRVAIMDRGRIVALDSPKRLKASLSIGQEEPTLEGVFLSLTGKEIRD